MSVVFTSEADSRVCFLLTDHLSSGSLCQLRQLLYEWNKSVISLWHVNRAIFSLINYDLVTDVQIYLSAGRIKNPVGSRMNVVEANGL